MKQKFIPIVLALLVYPVINVTAQDRIPKTDDNVRAGQIKALKSGMFVCWSFSTFSGNEWTPTLDKDASYFKATGCDTDQWCQVAKDAGMGYILFLTKHHDGFCLWDTKTTEKKVTNSPLGMDVLRRLRNSCDRYGIKLALYFSEGDWNWPGAVDGKGWRSGAGVDPETKKAQLKELCTDCGPIEFFWMDHAVGDGGLSHRETVDWVHQFQPDCFVGFNHGEPAGRLSLRERGSPGPVGDTSTTKYNKDAEASYEGYLVAEFTYPILPEHEGGADWFYSLPRHDGLCKPAEDLYRDYLGAVKYGNIFSINVGPDYEGKLREIDMKTLHQVGKYIKSSKSEYTNIVIIYADDLGYGDVQSYNPASGKIPTPNIDRLAAQGMRFTDAHSSSAVCSPSRYTLLTGRYHWRTHLQKGIVGVFGAPLITPGRLTIVGLAKQHGYQTACIGKWHLGWEWPIPEEQRDLFRSDQKRITASDEHRAVWQEVFSQPIPGGPTAVGFDEYFGTDVPNWPPFCFIENDRTVGIPTEFGSGRLFGKNQASQQGHSLKDWKLEDVLPALGDRSVDFIERMAESPDPFLLYLPLTSPHTPLSVNKEWRGKSGLGLYADLVMETDAVVGQVLDALEKSGEAGNTLLVFTSDNGCAPYIGNTTIEEARDTTFRDWSWDRKKHEDMPVATLEEKGHYPSGPLRGYKSDAWEGGHRVPFIVKWPGTVKPGSSCSQLVHQADIMATIADILEVSLPPDAGEDSYSLLPLLKGKDNPIREHAVSASISGVPSLRWGPWKLILTQGSGGWSPGGDSSDIQLYNLDNDPGETENLAEKNPERVAQMKRLLEKIISDGRSTPGSVQKNDVEVIRYSMN